MRTYSYKTTLGKHIVDHGYSIIELGTKLGFKSRNSFREVLDGRKNMPVERWVILSQLLNIDLTTLINMSKEVI